MTLYKWSQTAAADASADSTINWAEGQSPASVNDSARAMMAATAKFRDDIAGAIVTGGTSTAYTISSYQQFDSLAHLDGKMIAFTPHVTNGANGSSLNVDGLGVKPILTAPGAGLPGGVLIQGTPYVALYNNTDGAFYLQGFFGNPYNLPIGGMIDFIGPTAPNSSFVLPFGQAISRTTYAALFALIGTTFGAGDGTTTFNIPDLRGRFVAGKDDMGGVMAGRLGNVMSSATLGATGGSQQHTLTLAELPTGITASGSGTATVSPSGGQTLPTGNLAVNTINAALTLGSAQTVPYLPAASGGAWSSATSLTGTSTASVTSNNTSGAAHSIIPPTIIANKILRII